MKLSALFLVICFLIGSSVTAHRLRKGDSLLGSDTLVGGITTESTDSEEATSQLESGLSQMAEMNLIDTSNIVDTTIISYQTQVVSGELYMVLAELTLSDGTHELVYVKLWDAPWEGMVDALQTACTYTSDDTISGTLCSDASDCLELVQNSGDCVTAST